MKKKIPIEHGHGMTLKLARARQGTGIGTARHEVRHARGLGWAKHILKLVGTTLPD